MWDVKTLIIDLIRTKNIQAWINNRFKSDNKTVLYTSDIATVKTDYAVFNFDGNYDTLAQVRDDYKTDDMRPSDIVLDIGACIGAFTLKAAKMSYRVYAIEPLMCDALRANIALNPYRNVEIIEAALGSGKWLYRGATLIKRLTPYRWAIL